MPKVLIVSRYFPPSGSPGASIRLTKMIKFASRYDWEFIILTQHPDYPVVPEENKSHALLDDIVGFSNVRVEYVPKPQLKANILPKNCFRLWEESSMPWVLVVLLKGISILINERVDLVFSNSPPFSSVAIGAVLSCLYSIPFVIDMKDDWIGSTIDNSKNSLIKGFRLLIERGVFTCATTIFVATDLSLRNYRSRYKGHFNDDKFQFIPNGFDQDEYPISKELFVDKTANKFTILSAALGYRPNYRDLTSFIKSVEIFLKNNPKAESNFEIVFLGGKISEVYLDQFRKIGLFSQVKIVENLKRGEFVKLLRCANLFFLVQPKGNTTAISGTLFEYWAAGRSPILLISEEGASSQLIKNNSIGEHFLFDQETQIASYIQSVYDAYCLNEPILISSKGISNFDRKKTVETMLQNFRRVIDPGDEV